MEYHGKFRLVLSAARVPRGFDGTSNVLAGKLFHIPVKGTHAHSYITSFTDFAELKTKELLHTLTEEASDGELAALISFAIAFPDGFMALVDTYDVQRYHLVALPAPAPLAFLALFVFNPAHDCCKKLLACDVCTLAGVTMRVFEISITFAYLMHGLLVPSARTASKSGLLNFCAVSLALNDLGYQAIGVRIDSGDLAYLSNKARETFEKVAQKYNLPWFAKITIVASNDINEETILSLNEQGHKIDCFGIGTHLVTCQRQPALGCVYKMVEINGLPKIKLSQDVGKVTMPGRKDAYRLYGADGHALIDLLQRSSENPPQVGEKVLCRHPFQESKRAYVIPTRVEPLYKLYWKDGHLCTTLPSLCAVRERVQASLRTLRQDHKRNLNPTPYKVRRVPFSTCHPVAVSGELYNFIHDLWLLNAPIGELS
ncbi:hypothetical protein B566_EDAN012362 [Ephemera danica]|nr:hypothetical protein B566_EDAN012362 [Ephemera danica]